ncbi:MAG TPA: oxidoreductase [Gammaproteobacteria bacterium]|nr:oxidoreductase [Gammaproteobacteria bacterium]
MQRFRAYRVHDEGGRSVARFEELGLDDLSGGDVVIAASHSSVNYKDALAATGRGKILHRFPLVPGIDVAGRVHTSDDPRYRPGDPVLVTGCGIGEDTDGGYSEYVRVKGECVIPIPAGLDERGAMRIGTAGFTAALAIEKMELNGQAPGQGPVVVTGATGGVGSFAVDMLAGRGYEVVAVTGKAEAGDYLRGLGAREILLRDDIDLAGRPLERARWAGAIDQVGGSMLAWLLRTTGWWGNVACVGLAGGHELHTTVMPFILRGVSLLGINSMATPRARRLAVWERLAGDLKPAHLEAIGDRTVDFDELPAVFDELLSGRVTGRTVVRLGR